MSSYIYIAASLLLISILMSQVADRFGVPKLLFFLTPGMLARPEGSGRISFVDPIAAVRQLPCFHH
ncbi:MAG: hypothetical protein ACOC7Y_02875, partial [Chloroflexota bacterium]